MMNRVLQETRKWMDSVAYKTVIEMQPGIARLEFATRPP
jgi:hypothetical protein